MTAPLICSAPPAAPPAVPPPVAPPPLFDWCIACEERPTHDNSLLCWDCDEELPFTVGDFLAQGVDQAIDIALARIIEVGWTA